MAALSQIYDKVTAQAWEVFLICVAVCAIVYTLIWFFEQVEVKNDANALRKVTSATEPQEALTAQPVPTQPKSDDFLKRLGPDAADTNGVPKYQPINSLSNLLRAQNQPERLRNS